MINANFVKTYDEFCSLMSSLISSATKSIEQVIQYDSKYFKADKNLFRYDIDLLLSHNKSSVSTKKLYVILRNKEELKKEQYQKYIGPYEKCGFDIKNIFLCDVKSTNNIELDDLILIDDSICVTAETKNSQNKTSFRNDITNYYISHILTNENKIKKARTLLYKLRKETFEQHTALRILEPLADSADINYHLSIENCQNGIMSNGDCRWYHSVWQYLRIINKVSSPEWHSTFYKNCFDNLMKEKEFPKILISGTADYSLLAYVYDSVKNSKKSATIYVLDSCKTPLKICEWYAQKLNFKIQTININILDLNKTNIKFDLICSDAFLTRFTKENAEKVVNCWHQALNKSGIVVTTVRARNFDSKEDNNFLLLNYVNDCIERFKKWEGYFEISSFEFESMVKKYAKEMTSHNLGDKKSIMNIFTSQGFKFDNISTMCDTPGEFTETTYFEICCRKE